MSVAAAALTFFRFADNIMYRQPPMQTKQMQQQAPMMAISAPKSGSFTQISVSPPSADWQVHSWYLA